MCDKVKAQILAVRDTGRTNMFDTNAVQVITNEMKYYELVVFIEEHKSEYIHFINTGEFGEDNKPMKNNGHEDETLVD